PGLAVVARDVERTVVRAGPDDTRLRARFADRVQRAVYLFTRGVARDRSPAAQLLRALRIPREVRRDLLPRAAAILRAMDVLRSVVHHAGIAKRNLQRRHALE